MLNTKISFILFITLFFIVGCGSDSVDLNPPSISINSFTPQPGKDEICGTEELEVFRLAGGDELAFDALLTDNEALSQYKIDIHNNFDCHGHGGGVAPSVAVPTVENLTLDWTVLKINDVTGTSTSVSETLNVPQNVTAGNYHFHIQVIDEAGNDSPFANYYSLKITNPLDAIPPIINSTMPSSAEFSVKKGEVIHFEGTVTDDRSLSDGGNGLLYLAYTDLSSGNTFTTDKVFPFDESTVLSYNYDFDYVVPQTLVAGDYRLSLGALDGVRNVAPFIFFDVKITN